MESRKSLVCFRLPDLVHDELHGIHRIHLLEEPSENPDPVEIILRDQEFFLSRPGPDQIESRENPAVGNPAIQMELHIAGSLEFFKDDFIHPASRIDQGGGNDGQAAAVLDIPGGTEEPLRLVQGIGIHTAGQDLAAGRHDRVVGPGQPGDAVQEDDHILPVLHQPFRLLDHHLGNLDMARGRFVKGGRDDLALHAPLHVRHFFGTFINQKHHQDDFLDDWP